MLICNDLLNCYKLIMVGIRMEKNTNTVLTIVPEFRFVLVNVNQSDPYGFFVINLILSDLVILCILGL